LLWIEQFSLTYRRPDHRSKLLLEEKFHFGQIRLIVVFLNATLFSISKPFKNSRNATAVSDSAPSPDHHHLCQVSFLASCPSLRFAEPRLLRLLPQKKRKMMSCVSSFSISSLILTFSLFFYVSSSISSVVGRQ